MAILLVGQLANIKVKFKKQQSIHMSKSNNPQIEKLKALKDEYKKEMWAGNTRNGFHIYCQIVELEKELGLPISMK